jgi:hypothetical protein
MQRLRTFNTGTSAYDKDNNTSSMTDWVLVGGPGYDSFEKLRDRGVLVNNPMSLEKIRSQSWRGFVTCYVNRTKNGSPLTPQTFVTSILTQPWVTMGVGENVWRLNTASILNGYLDELTDMSDTDIAMAVTDVSARLSRGIAAVWVTLAESSKTLKMLARGVRALRTPVLQAMRIVGTNIRKLARSPKDREEVIQISSKLWMEARYGYRPMVYDAMALYDASIRVKQAGGRLTKVKIVGNEESTIVKKWTDLSCGYCRAQLDFDLSIQKYVKTGQTADFNALLTGPIRVFGIADISTTAWELLPFSWVVDKFINVTDVLGACQTSLMVDERIGWTSKVSLASIKNMRVNVTRESHYQTTTKITSTWAGHDLPDSQGKTQLEYRVSSRSEVVDFRPILGWEDKLKLAELIDLMALFKVLFRGGRQ